MIGVVLNIALFAAMLGFPYCQGRTRSLTGRDHFAKAVACLYGGEPAADPGFALPEGEELHYAALAISDAEWPQRCRESIAKIAPDEANALLPSVKESEQNIRDAVSRLLELIDEVPPAPRTVIPADPRAGVRRVVAALATNAQAADASRHLEEPAIVFPGEPNVVLPERMPLRAGEGAEVQVQPSGDGIAMVGVDRTGISRAIIRAGSGDVRRARRPARFADFAMMGDDVFLFWRTPDDRCGEGRCVHRATGMAKLSMSVLDAPIPRWLAAHVELPVRDHVRVDEGSIQLIARAEDGRELRTFPLSALDEEGDRDAPLAATNVTPLPRAARFVGDHLVTLVAVPPDPAAEPALATPPTYALHVDGEARGGVHGESLSACAPWVVVRTAAGPAHLVHLESGQLVELESAAADLACDDEALFFLGATETTRCTQDGCEAGPSLPEAPRRVVVSNGRMVVAKGGPDHAPILVGPPRALRLVAPCWSNGIGFCGEPIMAAGEGRVFVGARAGEDVLLLETTDQGETFRRARGLR